MHKRVIYIIIRKVKTACKIQIIKARKMFFLFANYWNPEPKINLTLTVVLSKIVNALFTIFDGYSGAQNLNKTYFKSK